MGSPAPESQMLRSHSQESDRRARSASGRRPLADGHRARPGRRTRAALKRTLSDEANQEPLPIRKSFAQPLKKAWERRPLATVAEHQKKPAL